MYASNPMQSFSASLASRTCRILPSLYCNKSHYTSPISKKKLAAYIPSYVLAIFSLYLHRFADLLIYLCIPLSMYVFVYLFISLVYIRMTRGWTSFPNPRGPCLAKICCVCVFALKHHLKSHRQNLARIPLGTHLPI